MGREVSPQRAMLSMRDVLLVSACLTLLRRQMRMRMPRSMSWTDWVTFCLVCLQLQTGDPSSSQYHNQCRFFLSPKMQGTAFDPTAPPRFSMLGLAFARLAFLPLHGSSCLSSASATSLQSWYHAIDDEYCDFPRFALSPSSQSYLSGHVTFFLEIGVESLGILRRDETSVQRPFHLWVFRVPSSSARH